MDVQDQRRLILARMKIRKEAKQENALHIKTVADTITSSLSASALFSGQRYFAGGRLHRFCVR